MSQYLSVRREMYNHERVRDLSGLCFEKAGKVPVNCAKCQGCVYLIGSVEREKYHLLMKAHLEQNPLVHVFVCTRTKEKGESCGPKGGGELRDQLKHWTKDIGISRLVKITASLCLSHCENGISVCIYPENEWFLKVDKEKDVGSLKDEILSLLEKAQHEAGARI